MEETLNSILSELKHLNKEQQDLIIVQKELLGRIENLEKCQKRLMTNSTKNINKVYEEIKMGQQQLKFQIEDLKIKDPSTLGQNELKELIIKTTAYMSGKLSVSERMKLEIEWLNENERQELLNNINEKKLESNRKRWSNDWDDDPYNDY